MMTGQITFYLVSIWLTGVLSAFLAFYAWKQRQVPGARAYARLALVEFALVLAENLSILSPSVAGALFWFQVRYLAAAVIPVFWLAFALEYSGRQAWLSRRFWLGLLAIPFLTQLLLWTNAFHGLWTSHDVGFTRVGAFWLVDLGQRLPGLGYLTHTFYGFFLILAGIALLFLAAWKLRREDASQAALLALAGLTAAFFIANALFDFFPNLEFNPFTPGIGLSITLVALAVFRYQFLRHAPAAESLPRFTRLAGSERSSLAPFLLILLLIVSGLSAGAYFSYGNYQRQIRAQVEKQLDAIVQIKSSQIHAWRAERLGNGEVLHNNPVFASLVQTYLENPATEPAHSQLQAWLDGLQTTYRYRRVFLLDAAGRQRLISPIPLSGPLAEHLIVDARAVLADGQVVFLDFHRHAPGSSQIYLAVLVPIYSRDVPRQALGLVVLQIDPAVSLYPFLEQWPVPSQTAETLLVRREGETVLFLNPLRFDPTAALNRRFSLTETEVLAVKAVLGQTDVVEGRDYRGQAVIGALASIPGSPWFLVGRMDLAEVYAPVRERLWQTMALYGLLVLISGGMLWLFWRQQRLSFYREQLVTREALQQSEQKYRVLFDEMLSGLAVHEMLYDETDQPVDYRFLAVNPAFEKITGLRAADLLGKTVLEVLPATESTWIKNYGEVVRTRQPAQFENYSSEIGKYFEVRVFSPEPGKFATIINDITERKQADEALHRSELVLKEAQTIAHLGNWTWDLNKGEIIWSDEMYRIFGIEKNTYTERLGDAIAKVIHPDDLPIVLPGNAAALASGPVEYRIIRPDASIRYIWAKTGETIFDNSRQPVFLKGVAQDITARKQAEQALQESENKYRALVEKMQVGVIAHAPDTSILFANPRASELLGLTEDQLLGKTALDPAWCFIWEDGTRMPLEAYPVNQALDSAEPISNLSLGILHPDRPGPTWVHCNAHKILNLEGHLQQVVVTFFDITARKQAEDAVRESEKKYRQLHESLMDGFVSVDLDGKFLECNEIFLEMLGYSSAELADLSYLDLTPEKWRVYEAEIVENQILKRGYSEIYEKEYCRKDGTIFPVELHAVLVRDEQGHPTHMWAIVRDITARKQAEEAVRETNEYLDNLFNYANAPIIVWDPQFKITRFNHAFEKLTGRQAAEVLGEPLEILFPTAQMHISLELIRKTQIGERWEVVEISIQHLDGSLRTVLWNSATLFAPDGVTPLSTIAQGQDITERRRAEDLLRARLRLFEFAAAHSLQELLVETLDAVCELTTSPIGFYHLVDADEQALTLQAWSTRTSREYCQAEGSGQHYPIAQAGVWVDCLRERRPVIHNDYASLPNRQGLPPGHAPLIRELVVPIIRQARAVAILGIGNKGQEYTAQDIEAVTYFADLAWEIAERKRGEAELLQSRENFSRAFLSSPTALAITRRSDGQFLDLNEAYVRVMGYPAEEILGRTLAELQIFVNPAERDFMLQQIEAQNELRDYELLIKARSGQIRQLLVSMEPIIYDQQPSLIATFIDITERKQAEQKLAEYSTRLSEMVDERTRELRQAQERLVRQERLAVLGQLAGSVSHELRNPLGVISNAVYYLSLAQPQADPKVLEYLEIIRAEMRIADKIVADLLNYARLKTAEREPVTVEPLILRTLERYPVPKEVDLTLKIQPDLPLVWVDSDQITRVLGNLLVNAFQAMEGHGELVLRAYTVTEDHLVSIVIEDTGGGISPENLTKIFEPLFTTKARGIGLGLAICKNLVESNGGRIEVDSELGKGSTFTVSLPTTQEIA
jgi:PAS domain S-box-containing protein